MKSYSQKKQDLICLDFFNSFPPLEKFFVDCGAFDGINYSNTRLLFEHGWTGICVEPCSKNYEKLSNLYKDSNVITVKAAVSDFTGTLDLNIATIPGSEDWGSDVSSLSTQTIHRWPEYQWSTQKTKVQRLDEILSLHKITKVAFVSIDVEGLEFSVLRGFKVDFFTPDLMVIEYANEIERKKILNYIRNYDYFLWIDNNQDIFVVKGRRIDYFPKLLFIYTKWKTIFLIEWLARKIKIRN